MDSKIVTEAVKAAQVPSTEEAKKAIQEDKIRREKEFMALVEQAGKQTRCGLGVRIFITPQGTISGVPVAVAEE